MSALPPHGHHLTGAAYPYEQETPVTDHNPDRPNPLMNVAAKIGPAWGAVSGVLVAGVPLGILSQTQVDAIDAAGDSAVDAVGVIAPIVGGVVALVLAAIQSFVQAQVSKGDVTPSKDPRDDQGVRLTPEGQ